ncbi:hypothetical protein [Neolewinella antarctica]|uniref:Lipoprotein n=1 Tax=Neolewinella antarctica TaxID=442734 RepID=A0ABX0X8Z9_9BACT|nr:hypothetical protein [Neolewinella antarctica]NJC25657.1 hypothetical protein [Neolewinella antarctica]
MTITLFSCGGSGETVAQSGTFSGSSDLKLNEKGRITSAVILTLADGPFAGTYELGNEVTKGSVRFSATSTEHVEKHPKFAGTSALSTIGMRTEDGSFGIGHVNRVFTGEPQTGHLPSMTWKDKNAAEARCGTMLLKIPGSEDIRHIYVDFLDCSGIDISGFGDEWKASKYSANRTRPVAGKFSERVQIEDINSTKDTKDVHETTMTFEFVGGQNVEL